MKNIQRKPSNVDPKSDRIQSKQTHKYVGNHAKIPNPAFIHFDYQTINMIFLKWISVQNQNSRIKTPQKIVIDANKTLNYLLVKFLNCLVQRIE
jgi:hypothetical protein